MSDAPAVPPATSRWEDLLDVFISPVELFRRRSDGKFGFALLMLLVLSAVVFFATKSAMQPIMDAEFQRGMASRPGMTPEQMETARKFAGSLAPVFILIGLPVGVFILGAVIWLAARLVGGRMGYAQGATIATFAFYPRIVEGIANGVQALLMDEGNLTSRLSVSLGVGRFLDPRSTGAAALALLGRIDLFTLWATLLVGIGIKQIAKTTTGQAVGAAAMVWLVGCLPVLLQAMRAG